MATQQQVADHIDVGLRHVKRLVKSGVLPPAQVRGGQDLDACRLAYIRYLRGLSSGQVEAPCEVRIRTF